MIIFRLVRDAFDGVRTAWRDFSDALAHGVTLRKEVKMPDGTTQYVNVEYRLD